MAIPFLLTLEFTAEAETLRTAARVQIVARKYGFKPVWLVGVEALRHPVALEPLARWQKEGEAEVGALLDPEVVPPTVDLGSLAGGRKPLLTDYPESVMDAKLSWLTSSIEQVVGKHPVSIRSVRPSVDDRYYALLAKHGYKIDLTVAPHAKIGPTDFTGYSEKAYLTPQGVLELPRTVRRKKYGTLVEELLRLPGFMGAWARALFPPLRCFRLRKGNRGPVKHLVAESLKAGSEHLDLRVSARDWKRGDRLVRDLERVLASVNTAAVGVTAEEFLQRYKNEQLRKGLV